MPELISITLLCNFTEITIRHGCSPGNLLHILGKSFPKNTSGRLLLQRLSYPTLIKSLAFLFSNLF